MSMSRRRSPISTVRPVRHHAVSGDLLANDTLAAIFLGIKMLVGGTFVDVGDAAER